MSTVYSLVCWGGLTGKTVTMTIASPCVVTSTNHGLRDGTGLRFKSNGDTLPTGLTSGVTYYAKSTAANTFNLYSDAALTTIINTSGSQSGTHILQSLFVADPATTLASYGLSDLSRYGSSGSERVYGGLVAWNSGRSGASAYDTEVCEVGEVFTEIVSSDLSISVPAASSRIETKINGIRTAAFHAGVYLAGYRFQRNVSGSSASISLTKYRITVDGFTITVVGSGYGNGGISLAKAQCSLLNMYVVGRFDGAGNAVSVTGVLSSVVNCVSIGWANGIYIDQYIAGIVVANSLFSKNTTGVNPVNAQTQGFYYNNISVGNTTTNWGTQPTSMEGAANNAGLSGQAWGAATRITIATTDFIDHTNNNFKPALSTSPQVEAGIEYYGANGYDLEDAVRPNYMNGAAAYYDVGAFEFDHGYGLAPASTTVTFTGVNAGSEIRVYNAAGSEIAGVESCDANHALTWNVDATALTIRIVHTAYKIKEFQYTNVEGSVSLPIQQEADKWYSNP